MALMRGSVRQLLEMADAGLLPDQLEKRAVVEWGSAVGAGEVRSWRKSLSVFLRVVDEAGLGDVEALLEHRLPHSPKRVDVILCGTDPNVGTVTYVLVELKQWSEAELIARELVRVPYYDDPVLHPVAQVRQYCRYLVDFTPALEHRVVRGIAFLHNATAAGVASLADYELDEFGRLFLGDDDERLRGFLTSVLDADAGRDRARAAADEFVGFPHRPTKKLLDSAAYEIQSREQFVLLDEQRVAYETVALAVNQAWEAECSRRKGSPVSHQKTVVVVVGGPGSGKSVIALSLLGHLARKNLAVNHATGSSAFTRTMQRLVGSRERSLFKYFNNFANSRQSELDVLICDEAHRIRTVSSNAGSGSTSRPGRRTQLDELISVAAVPVLFLDDNQVVRPYEVGSLAAIEEGARAARCDVDIVHLKSQFRCGGSDLFEDWVDRLLGVVDDAPIAWSTLVGASEDDFLLGSADTPAALDDWVRERHRQAGGLARLTAGFCWDWTKRPTGPRGNRSLVSDVRIDEWSRPWNAFPGSDVSGAPDSYYWAFENGGMDQVGCIYTAQGFEYDWAGVIFGDDFVRRGDRWVARREHSYDSEVKKADDVRFPGLIRNTYKVLLTRGMRGACVYSTDEETRSFFERMTA
ncbi:DNA/RNA helicase domain-containing protein [Nocardia sp. NBC_00511]|uniref:DNA/RNA helicase domain-containing protein n=1 Tax=Nocardia sp. NBC_00511 TaxID=2903591 RepID=UPI0030E0F32F